MCKIVFILFLLLVCFFFMYFFAIYIAFELFIKAVELHHVRNKKKFLTRDLQDIFDLLL